MPLIAQNQTSTDVVARPTFAQNYFTSSSSKTSQGSLSSNASSVVTNSSKTSSSKVSVQPSTAIDLKDTNSLVLFAGMFIVILSIFLTVVKYRSTRVFENKLSKLDV